MVDKVQRSVFATGDRAEGLAVLEQIYAVQGTRRGSDEAFSMSVSTAGVEPVSLERVCWQGTPADGVGEHPGVLRVGQVLAGRSTFPTAGTLRNARARSCCPGVRT